MKPYFQDANVTIFCARCQDVLPTLRGQTIGLVATDPPYNVGKEYGVVSDSLSDEAYRHAMGQAVAFSTLLCENQVWVAPRYKLAFWLDLLPDSHLVVVERKAAGPFRQGWSDQFEIVLATGKPNKCYRDLWQDIRLKGEGYFFREDSFEHPGYTPEMIFTRSISLLSEVGETVVDPFMGTGTSGVAAKKLGRKYIGIEADEKWCKLAVERISQLSVMPL